MHDQAPTIQERIRSAVRQRESGDPAGARAALEAMLSSAQSSSAFDWLFFAHSFADVQEDLAQELHWDLTALDAMNRLTEAEAIGEGVPGGRVGLLPSLHLNLADVYHRLGKEDEARRHYEAGVEHLHALDEGTYGTSIREAFQRFAESRSQG